MKKISAIVLLFIIASICYSSNTANNKNAKINLEVTKIQGHEKFYKNNCFYLSGQPSKEDLVWLKQEGVKKIINLRSENENEKFSQTSYNEEKVAKELNIEYVSIPVSSDADYSPEKLEQFANELNNNKILIHCASAGRVTYFMMAYYIKYKNVSKEDAITFGKQIKYKSYIDLLLNK